MVTSQRNTSGGLLVVEQKQDGWYLIDNALDERRELLRSSHPVLDYSVTAGNVHIAVVVEGPDGPETSWIHSSEVSQIDGRTTSLGWFGTHQIIEEAAE